MEDTHPRSLSSSNLKGYISPPVKELKLEGNHPTDGSENSSALKYSASLKQRYKAHIPKVEEN